MTVILRPEQYDALQSHVEASGLPEAELVRKALRAFGLLAAHKAGQS